MQSLSVGGRSSDRAYLSGRALVSAGTIRYTVGSSPSAWATADSSLPRSEVRATAPARTTAALSSSSVIVPAGQSASVTLSVVAQGNGTLHGTAVGSAGQGVTVSVAGNWQAAADGGTVKTDLPVTVAVAAGTAPGSYPVQVSVTARGLQQTCRGP